MRARIRRTNKQKKKRKPENISRNQQKRKLFFLLLRIDRKPGSRPCRLLGELNDRPTDPNVDVTGHMISDRNLLTHARALFKIASGLCRKITLPGVQMMIIIIINGDYRIAALFYTL